MSKSAEMLKCFESIQPLKKAYEAYSEMLEELRESAGRNQDPRFKKLNDDQIRILEEQKEQAGNAYLETREKAEAYFEEIEKKDLFISSLIRLHYCVGFSWKTVSDCAGWKTRRASEIKVQRFFQKLEAEERRTGENEPKSQK